jgi:hypothetical protein
MFKNVKFVLQYLLLLLHAQYLAQNIVVLITA